MPTRLASSMIAKANKGGCCRMCGHEWLNGPHFYSCNLHTHPQAFTQCTRVTDRRLSCLGKI